MNWEVFNTSTEINTHISEISDIFKEAVIRSSNSEELIVANFILGSLKSWLRLVFVTISGRKILSGYGMGLSGAQGSLGIPHEVSGPTSIHAKWEDELAV